MSALNTPSVQEIILRLPQPNYAAALSHHIPCRPSWRRSPFNMTDQCPYWTSNPASVVRLICLRSGYCAYIIMHLKYPGHRRKHNTGVPATPYFSNCPFFLFIIPSTGSSRASHPEDSSRVRVRTITQGLLLSRNPLTKDRRRRRATGGPK